MTIAPPVRRARSRAGAGWNRLHSHRARSAAIGVALALVAAAMSPLARAQSRPELAEPERQAVPRVGPGTRTELSDFDRAERLARRGDLDAALAAVDRHLQTAPLDVRGRFLRGVILTDLKRTDEAIAIFNELTVQQPQLPEPYNNLAVLYASTGQLERARVALERAAIANPKSVTVQENLGDVYLRLAEEAYQRATKLEPARTSLRTRLQAVRTIVNTPRAAAATPPDSPFLNGATPQ